MYAELIPKVKQVLETVSAVKAVYSYPLAGNPAKYPAAIFFPDAVQNAFETNAENAKVYRFRLYLVVNLGGTDEEEVFSTVLPRVVDAVLAAFDAAWDFGTSVAGHRTSLVVDSGQWGFSAEQKSKEAFAELILNVRALTSI